MNRTRAPSARAPWALVTLAVVVQLIGLRCTVARTEVDPRHSEVSPYEAIVNGDEISIFEMVEMTDMETVEEEDDEVSTTEELSTWSRIRSLMGTAKFDKIKNKDKNKNKKIDCRKPQNKKKKACRKPSTPAKRPPPPKRRPPPPPPPRPRTPNPVPSPVNPPPDTSPEEGDAPYEAPDIVPSAPPPPVSIPYNQVTCDRQPRRKILSGPRMVPNGGLRACTGLHVADAGACCQTCRGTVGCNGWMYTRPLDCRMFGEPNPQNVCYMLSDTTGSYDPVSPELEYFSGTAVY